MAVSRTVMENAKRDELIAMLVELLKDEDTLRIASNAIAFPIMVGEEEAFAKIVVSIPRGSKDEAFDGYEMAEDYALHLKEKAEKAEAAKAKKERKAKQDADRRAKAKAKKEERAQ